MFLKNLKILSTFEDFSFQNSMNLASKLKLSELLSTFEFRFVFKKRARLKFTFKDSRKWQFSIFASEVRMMHTWNESEMMEGWIPLARSCSAASRRDPAKTQTDVVPSPASASWAWLSSTNILAQGLTTFIYKRKQV